MGWGLRINQKNPHKNLHSNNPEANGLGNLDLLELSRLQKFYAAIGSFNENQRAAAINFTAYALASVLSPNF